jgi:acetyltransferase
MTTPSRRTDAVPAGGWATLRDGRTVLVRAAGAADAPLVQAFVRALSPQSRRRRFLGPVAELSPGQLDRLTRVRDPRETALVALAPAPVTPRVVGVAQYALEGDAEAEFALAVADDWHRQGLGARLLATLVARAESCGLQSLSGEVLADNWPMLGLLAAAGFELVDAFDPQLVRARKPLAAPARGGVIARLTGAWDVPRPALPTAAAVSARF